MERQMRKNNQNNNRHRRQMVTDLIGKNRPPARPLTFCNPVLSLKDAYKLSKVVRK